MIQDGDWKEDEDEAWTTNNSDTLSYAIVASKAWIARSVVPEGGIMLVTLNGKAVSTYSEIAKSSWTHLIFVVLKQAVYTINLEKAAESIKEDKKLKITGMYVFNNNEKGHIEFNETQIAVNPGKQVTVRLIRVGRSKRKSTVEVITKDGTAKSGKQITPIGVKTLTFRNYIIIHN